MILGCFFSLGTLIPNTPHRVFLCFEDRFVSICFQTTTFCNWDHFFRKFAHPNGREEEDGPYRNFTLRDRTFFISFISRATEKIQNLRGHSRYFFFFGLGRLFPGSVAQSKIYFQLFFWMWLFIISRAGRVPGHDTRWSMFQNQCYVTTKHFFFGFHIIYFWWLWKNPKSKRRFTFFLDFGLFISAGPGKIQNLVQNFFFGLPLFISGGPRQIQKKGSVPQCIPDFRFPV